MTEQPVESSVAHARLRGEFRPSYMERERGIGQN